MRNTNDFICSNLDFSGFDIGVDAPELGIIVAVNASDPDINVSRNSTAGSDIGNPQPLISIVTVVWNNAEGLRRTLASVAEQSYPRLESIVIDGGSTDGTTQVIRDHQSMLAYWCSEPDRGIYHAMNKGVGHVSGALTLFLNSADTLAGPDALQRFVDDCYRTPDSGVPGLYLCAVRTDRGVLKRPKLLWLKQHYMLPVYHQGMLYPTQLLKSTPFSERYRIVSDLHHFLRIRRAVKLLPCELTLAVYDTTGISSVNVLERDREYQQTYRDLRVPRVFRWLKRVHELHALLRGH